MLKMIRRWFKRDQTKQTANRDADQASFQQLNRNAPLPDSNPASSTADTSASAKVPAYLSREAILGRDQRIAGYQFKLHEATRNRIRHSSRRVHHLYAEVLVRNLISSNIGTLLGHRFALLEVPDSFLAHPCLLELPGASTIVMLKPHPDENRPTLDELSDHWQRLHELGFRLALPDPMVFKEYGGLLGQAQLIVVQADAIDVHRGRKLSDFLNAQAPQATLLVRELPLLEHFQLAFKLGSQFFQGPFITSREDWEGGHLNPNTVHLMQLINHLRADGDTRAISALLKQDGALALRLLRIINSTAYHHQEATTSIEHALIMLGREPLYRWLMMLAFTVDKRNGRSSAALETALIRGRMLELLGKDDPVEESDALFLLGLLSLADVIMQQPLEKVIAPLKLPVSISAALRGEEGSHHDLLQLAIACESDSKAAQIDVLAARCQVSPAQAVQAHLDALIWALKIQKSAP